MYSRLLFRPRAGAGGYGLPLAVSTPLTPVPEGCGQGSRLKKADDEGKEAKMCTSTSVCMRGRRHAFVLSLASNGER